MLARAYFDFGVNGMDILSSWSEVLSRDVVVVAPVLDQAWDALPDFSLIAVFTETQVVSFHSAAVERLDPRNQGPPVEVDRVNVGPTTALASLVGFVFV